MNDLVKSLLEKNGRNLTAVAKLVGVTPAAVCAWVHGRAKPRRRTARKLKKYCEIPLETWGYEEKTEQQATNAQI